MFHTLTAGRRACSPLERFEAKHIYDSLADTHVLRLVESAMEHAAER